MADKELGWLCEKPKGSAFCTPCGVTLTTLAGKMDLLKHASTSKHKNKCTAVSFTPSITKSIVNLTGLNAKTTDAELKLSAFCVEHDISFRTMDHMVALFKSMFPDCEVAQNMKCGRTKTTKIVKNVIAKEQLELLVAKLNKNKFSLMADESTDRGNKKLLSLVVRLAENNQVNDFLLGLIEVVQADALTLHKAIVDFFNEHKINYKQNLIGFAADGANVMTGKHNSVATKLKEDVPNLVIFKCVCHSFALCSSYACKQLPNEIEELTRDIYNFIGNSPKRAAEFDEIQVLFDDKPHKLLRNCQTRWLSLQAVVQRILQKYDPLKAYFQLMQNSTDDVTKIKASAILKTLTNPVTEIFLEFLNYILPIINQLNRLFQSESAQIQNLLPEVKRLVSVILASFVQKSHLTNYKDKLNQIRFQDPRFYLPQDQVYLGCKADLLLKQNISANDIAYVKNKCLLFYIELTKQIFSRFNFEDPILINVQILNPENVISGENRSIGPLANLFPNLISNDRLQDIDTEWRELLCLDLDKFDSDNGEQFWKQVLTTKRGDGNIAFPILSKFIFEILSLPNSSAAVERVFSAINLNKTKVRNRLITSTLEAILLSKDYISKNSGNCYNLKISDSLRKRCNNTIYDKDATEVDK